MKVIPLYNYMLLPNSFVYIPSDDLRDETKERLNINDDVVLIPVKDTDISFEDISEKFYPIGVSGRITESGIQGYIAVNTFDRVDVHGIVSNPDGSLDAMVFVRDSVHDLSNEEREGRFRRMRDAVENLAKKTKAPSWWIQLIASIDTIEKITTLSSLAMNITADQRYELLEMDSEARRSQQMEKLVMEMIEISQLSIESNLDRANKNQKAYRESAIKHQMEYLQQQLDEMDPDGVSEIRAMEKRIENSKMNDAARKEAMKALNRMKQEGQSGHEYGMLYDYLDFLTGLSWEPEEVKQTDLDEAERILDEDHFGLKKIKDRIIQQIAVINLNRKQYGTILLFVGAPGTGKTSIGQSIAKALGRKYVRVSLGGIRDEADIRGHRRTYIGAMPGRIMDGIHKSGSSNPVMVLDEVDKIYASYNGDPASALLEVLDPEQNSTFTDHYMNVPYDLSKVMFICTANSVDTIPEPLLNRMEVIRFPGYTATDKFQIARKHLIPRAMDSMGIKEDQLTIDDDALNMIISDYTMETGVRGLKKRIDTLCRIAAVNLVKGRLEPLTVDKDNVRKYMDSKPVRHGRIISDTKPGIVTGLAWTASGGDILFIESSFMPGKGNIVLTGQLGDVMQESARIAVSLVRNMFPDSSELFRKNDIHIHVPDGAVKKDGPSAGITIVSALSSLITGRAVPPEYGMTGEVSLRGRVMPIGGLPEKLMAAQRAGVRTVFIPEDNVDDLDDVAEEIKNSLDIVPVRNVEEVLRRIDIIPQM